MKTKISVLLTVCLILITVIFLVFKLKPLKPVPVTGVTLDQTTATLVAGNSLQLTAIVAPANATNKNVTWSSSVPNVAQVDATGKITALTPGIATIIVTTEDGRMTAVCNKVGVLPLSPGKITLQHKTIRTVEKVIPPERKPLKAGPWTQDSWRDDLYLTYCSEKFPDGWHLVSKQLVVESFQGRRGSMMVGQYADALYDWATRDVSKTNQVCYLVDTRHHTIGESGKLFSFYIDYTIEGPSRVESTNVEEWVSENVVLNWGESKSFNCAPGAWKVSFDSFDGKHNEYSASGSNKFLDISDTTTGLQIKARNANEVVYP